MNMPEQVRVYEVGPRDGLQNEDRKVSTGIKITLIEDLAETGLSHLEIGSFVRPDVVPNMADSPDVYAAVEMEPDVTYPVLVPNKTGMEKAVEAGVEEVAIFAAATETFSQKNLNCSIEESMERFEPVVSMAEQHDIDVRGYVSVVAECPYEGSVDPDDVRDVAARLQDLNCYEISLGDTIGVGTPEQIKDLISVVSRSVPVDRLALHCHDTYGQALANIYAGLQEGITTVDSSVGGLGGCPFAPGAAGNVATEDVLYMLDGLEIETGVDLDRMVEIAWYISDKLNRKPRSRVANAIGPPET